MVAKKTPSTKTAFVVALAAAVATIPAVYAGLRAYDVLFMPQPNPALIGASVKIAMFWRLWIGVYVAPLVGAGAFAIARRDLARAVRLLHALVLAAAVMIAVQGFFLP